MILLILESVRLQAWVLPVVFFFFFSASLSIFWAQCLPSVPYFSLRISGFGSCTSGIWATVLTYYFFLYLTTWPVSRILSRAVVFSLHGSRTSPSSWVVVGHVPSSEYQDWHLPACSLLLYWGRSLNWTCVAPEGEEKRAQNSSMPLPWLIITFWLPWILSCSLPCSET
jgi:hypothetical protein